MEREGERGVCVKKKGGGVVECNGKKKVIQKRIWSMKKNLQIYKESK